MNIFLTSLWLIIMSVIGWQVGLHNEANPSVCALGFFILGVIIRLFPRTLEFVGDILD